MKRPTYTRRRLLAGVGATGVISVAGVSALTDPARGYTDTTTITASEGIQLASAWRATHNGDIVSGSGSGVQTTDSGATATLTNVLPGDSGTISFRVAADGEAETGVRTDLWVNNFASAENGIGEPEAAAGDTTPDEGELDDHLEVAVWHDAGLAGVGVFGGDNGARDLGERLVHPDAKGTLAEVARVLDRDAGVTIGECLGPDETRSVTMGWEFPSDIENQNVTQGDSVTFDLVIGAERCGGNS